MNAIGRIGLPSIPTRHIKPNRITATAVRTVQPRPRFAEGSDETQITRQLHRLLWRGRWKLTQDGKGLEASFQFPTFTQTWDFMTAVSLECKVKKHHPEWSNVYNKVYVRWTTHNPPGLSASDTEFAAICDRVAQDFGEMVDSQPLRNPLFRRLADAALYSKSGNHWRPQASPLDDAGGLPLTIANDDK